MTGAGGQRKRGRIRVRRPDRLMPGDFYGLTREALILESKAREVFTPHQPIFRGEFLCGRKSEIQQIVQALNTPGLHTVVCGLPGVGKSSLANVVADLMKQTTAAYAIVKRCDSSHSFETIVERALAAVGVDVLRVESVLQGSEVRKADARIADVGIGRERHRTVTATYRPNGRMSPAEAAEHLAPLDGLLVVDELHVVAAEERHRLALLGRHLSECGSRLKLVLVGTAADAAELVGPIGWTVRDIRLEPSPDSDLEQLVSMGVHALGMTVDPAVAATIAEVSAGFPCFAHLLALKFVEAAVGTGRTHLAMADLPLAAVTALGEADHSLKVAYDEANNPELLGVIAGLPADRFTVNDLRAAGYRHKLPDRMVSQDQSAILHRTERGLYRLSDARMRGYVRIRHLL